MQNIKKKDGLDIITKQPMSHTHSRFLLNYGRVEMTIRSSKPTPPALSAITKNKQKNKGSVNSHKQIQ